MYWIIRWIEMMHYQLFSRLGLRYSPQRHWHPRDEKNEGFIENAGSISVRQHVVPRSACLYQFFKLQGVPVSARADALDIKIQQWSPWQEVASWVVWQEKGAMVWIWDRSHYDFKSGYAIPETLLQVPVDDGCCRVVCYEGMELQVWERNILCHSFWKKNDFTEHEQQQWLALTGAVSQDWETHESKNYLPVPWAKNESSKKVNKTGWIQGAVVVSLFAFAFVSAALATEWYQWQQVEKNLETKHARLLVALQPVLAQRSQYQEKLNEVTALDVLSPREWQAGFFDVVLGALKEAECQPCTLVEWQYSGLQLELVVKADKLLEKKLVTVLSDTNKFSRVNLSPIRRNQQMRITLLL